MKYSAALVLVLLSCVFLVAGFATGSSGAFALAIFTSGVALFFLAQRFKTKRARTFITNPPPKVDPAWRIDLTKTENDRATFDDMEIDHVIDNYRQLVAAEILPALETLSAEELRKVIDVERRGRARQAIIRRAEVLVELTERNYGRAVVSEAIIDPGAPKRPRKTVSRDLSI